jgi:hypothetical protein
MHLEMDVVGAARIDTREDCVEAHHDVEDQEMAAILRAGRHQLARLQVDADPQHALHRSRRLAERIADRDRCHADRLRSCRCGKSEDRSDCQHGRPRREVIRHRRTYGHARSAIPGCARNRGLCSRPSMALLTGQARIACSFIVAQLMRHLAYVRKIWGRKKLDPNNKPSCWVQEEDK